MLKYLLPFLVVLNTTNPNSNIINGKILDNETKEELVGVKIISDCDTVYTHMDGSFEIKCKNDTTNLIFSYVSYSTDTLQVIKELNNFYAKK